MGAFAQRFFSFEFLGGDTIVNKFGKSTRFVRVEVWKILRESKSGIIKKQLR
jgi:hypothetical protein